MSNAAENLFTLNVITPHLEGFRPPLGEHDPAGDWELSYTLYTLGSIAGSGGPMGSLVLRRKAAPAGFVLAVDYRKRVPPDMTQEVSGEITCRQDTLGTPKRWTYASAITAAGGGPIKHTRLEKSATTTDGQIEIHDGRHRRQLPVAARCTIHWALFEAVGRLPRTPFEPIRFTLLDHFDQVKPNHTLSFRRAADVMLGGQAVRLHAYDHLGEGVVPWVYWVDKQGRPLFAVSGLEAYVIGFPQKG